MFLSCRQQRSRHLICRHSSWQYTFWGTMWLVTAASYPGMDPSSPGCDLDAPLGLSPFRSHFPVTTLPLWSPVATPTEHHVVLCPAPLRSLLLLSLDPRALNICLYWWLLNYHSYRDCSSECQVFIFNYTANFCVIYLIGAESVLRWKWALSPEP